MTELLKRMTSLIKAGFASAADKKSIADSFATLSSEEKEMIADKAKTVSELPDVDASERAELKEVLKEVLKGEVSEMKSQIETYMKEQDEQRRKGVGLYHPDIADKRKRMSDVLRKTTKALINGDNSYFKEMSTDASGSPFAGYVVDRELSAEIRHLMTEYGVARREMTAIPLSKGSYLANHLVTDVSVFWVDEGSAIGSGQVVLGQGELTLKKLAAIATFTSELLEDEEVDLISFVASRVAEGFARAEDLAFFVGDGTSTYGGFTGILNTSGVNEVVMAGTTFASLTCDDLLDMIDATPTGALEGAKFYYHRTIKSIIRRLKDSENRYVYQEPSATGPATVWGYPESLVEVMPKAEDTAADTPFIAFGNLKKAAILGFKSSGLVVSRHTGGVVRNVAGNADVNLITTDREAVRWTERTGMLVVIPTAITVLKTAPVSA